MHVLSRSRAALQKSVAHTTNTVCSRSSAPAAAAAAGGVDTDDIFAPRDSDSRGGRRGGRGSSGRWQQSQAAGANKRCSSLFGFLNYTTTSCGARLLRTNLLQPVRDIRTLQLRLDSLEVRRVCWKCTAMGLSTPEGRPCISDSEQLVVAASRSPAGGA